MSRPPPPGWLSRLDVIGGLALVVGRVSAAVAGLGPGVVGPEAAKQAGGEGGAELERLSHRDRGVSEKMHQFAEVIPDQDAVVIADPA